MEFIDYSQYRTWAKCPWAWWWKYVQRYQRRWPGQRRDALCLGSLVHDGLENLGRNKLPVIREKVIEEVTPTPETLEAARDLVETYARLYPNEDWELHRFEDPLRWPLMEGLEGLAKVDAYFYNPTPCQVESGVPDYQITLSPGWWIREYKTKDASLNRANWNSAWEVNMQASFQMLALQHKIGEPVQGVLVSVLEKPRLYVPKRKCKGCGEYLEMGVYLYTASTNLYSCPLCGFEQKLNPYEPKVRNTPQFYRVQVVRNAEQLATAEGEIVQVAKSMMELERSALGSFPPTRENCVHMQFGKCEYYNLDTYLADPEGEETLERVDTLRYTRNETEVI